MDRLFVGNIVQRTWIETWSDGARARGKEKEWLLKEGAILYKTSYGGYVDVESLNKKKRYKKS